VEYEKHKNCMVKYLQSVKEIKIAVFDKIKIIDETIA
jgi:hypothetical protein